MFARNEIYVIDLETTGLKPYPDDLILELSLTKVDLRTYEYDIVIDNTIYYDLDDEKLYEKITNSKLYKEGIITIDMIKNGLPLDKVINLVKKTLKGNVWTSYNTHFDYDKFLSFFKINPPAFCLMRTLTDIIRIKQDAYLVNKYGYDYYKYPRLSEAIRFFYNELDIKIDDLYEKKHRSLYDCKRASLLLIQLHKLFQIKDFFVNYFKNKEDKEVLIAYHKDFGLSWRVIRPISLTDHIIKAFCKLRNDYRMFNIYKIRSLGFVN